MLSYYADWAAYFYLLTFSYGFLAAIYLNLACILIAEASLNFREASSFSEEMAIPARLII
jgi:hypothetical protein